MTTAFIETTPGPPPVPGLAGRLGDLDAVATLALAESTTRARRFAELEDLLVAAHWADLHSDLPAHDPDLPAHAREKMIQPGGDGTPPMREFALAELSFARETHHATTRAAIADTLDLRHRLPLTFAVVRALVCEPWVARKVAVISRHLAVDRVGIVDRAIAAAIAGEPPAVVLELARAKTIEADPDHEAERLAFEAHRRRNRTPQRHRTRHRRRRVGRRAGRPRCRHPRDHPRPRPHPRRAPRPGLRLARPSRRPPAAPPRTHADRGRGTDRGRAGG